MHILCVDATIVYSGIAERENVATSEKKRLNLTRDALMVGGGRGGRRAGVRGVPEMTKKLHADFLHEIKVVFQTGLNKRADVMVVKRGYSAKHFHVRF